MRAIPFLLLLSACSGDARPGQATLAGGAGGEAGDPAGLDGGEGSAGGADRAFTLGGSAGSPDAAGGEGGTAGSSGTGSGAEGACGSRGCAPALTCIVNQCGCREPERTRCFIELFCRDLSSDNAACGACGYACVFGTTCRAGVCEPTG